MLADLATSRVVRLLAPLRRAADLPAHHERAAITFVEAPLDRRRLDHATQLRHFDILQKQPAE